jgi:hypothetical protein
MNLRRSAVECCTGSDCKRCRPWSDQRGSVHYWHGWFHNWSGTGEHARAIVEDKHGYISTYPMDEVRFVERPDQPLS